MKAVVPGNLLVISFPQVGSVIHRNSFVNWLNGLFPWMALYKICFHPTLRRITSSLKLLMLGTNIQIIGHCLKPKCGATGRLGMIQQGSCVSPLAVISEEHKLLLPRSWLYHFGFTTPLCGRMSWEYSRHRLAKWASFLNREFEFGFFTSKPNTLASWNIMLHVL